MAGFNKFHPDILMSKIKLTLSTSLSRLQLERQLTVVGRGRISEASTARTSDSHWRCFEYYQIDTNEFHIGPNLGKLKKDPCRCKQMIGPQLRSPDSNRSLFELKRNELTEC